MQPRKSGERKEKMNKKVLMTVATALVAGTLLARPQGGFGGPRGGFGGHRGPMPIMHHHMGPRMPMHRPPPPPRFHHHHHYSTWGRGGSHFWPGFVGGVVGGVIADAIVDPTVVASSVVTTPTVVTTPVYAPQPVYSTQQVWVPGAYVDQVQYNGTVVRVWQPGHYEARSVLVQ
jgi:hypothetical protein